MNIYKKYIEEMPCVFYDWFEDSIDPMIEQTPPWADPNNKEYKSSYILNNYGLRCDDFYPMEQTEDHVLFAGSESTIAINVDIDKVWSYMLYNDISSGNNFRSLAYPGSSVFKIIPNIFQYFNKIGNPKYLFCLFPEIIRDIGMLKIEKAFKPKLYNQYRQFPDKEHYIDASPNDLPIQLMILKYFHNIRMLEQYCNSNKINFIWSTSDNDTNELINDYKFNNFFNINIKFTGEYTESSGKLIDQEYLYKEFKFQYDIIKKNIGA